MFGLENWDSPVLAYVADNWEGFLTFIWIIGLTIWVGVSIELGHRKAEADIANRRVEEDVESLARTILSTKRDVAPELSDEEFLELFGGREQIKSWIEKEQNV